MRCPESDVLGLDRSPEMLARAAGQARPGLRFELGNIEDAGGSWDLIFSHAALQWVEGHATLIPRLLSLAAPRRASWQCRCRPTTAIPPTA